MNKQQIGDLRNLRKRAMPGPVSAVTYPGKYIAHGTLGGPEIRFTGSKRPENQAFVVAAFNHMDTLLDEIIRLQGERNVLVRLLERAVSVYDSVCVGEVDRDDAHMLREQIAAATDAINAVLAEQIGGA